MNYLPVITKDEEIRALKAMNAKLGKHLVDALDEMVRHRKHFTKALHTVNDTSKPEYLPEQKTNEGCSGAPYLFFFGNVKSLDDCNV